MKKKWNQFKSPQQNNYAFIDAQNLHVSLGRMGIKLDNAKFRQYLSDKYKVSKAFYFIGFRKKYQTVYTQLEKDGFCLVYKKTTERGTATKGNCDSDLILQVVREWKNFDQSVIISGDGDFLPLIEYLIENGKLKKIGIPTMESRSFLLKKFKAKTFFVERVSQKFLNIHKKRGVAERRDRQQEASRR